MPDATPPSADSRYDLVFLDTSQVTLFRTGGDAVRATITDPQIAPERTFLYVQIACAFPLSQPDQYVGLRDGKDKDIGMFRSLEGLDAESRAIVSSELHRRYFVPKVTRVIKVKKEFDTVTWEVETDKGPRLYHVQNLRDSVSEVQPGRVVVVDRTGSRFEFPDIRAIDDQSRSLLYRVLG